MPTLIHCLNTWVTEPHEQFEYYDFNPLYRTPEEDVWPESESEYEGEREPEVKVVERTPPRPQKSELEKKFMAESGGSDKLTPTQTVNFIQKNGYAPSKEDAMLMEKKYPNGASFKDVCDWMKEIEHKEDTAPFTIVFFKRYDPENTGKVTREQFKHLLRTHGNVNALTEDELQSLLKQSGKTQSVIEYRDLAETLLKTD